MTSSGHKQMAKPPELLRDAKERILRAVIRAIVYGHSNKNSTQNEKRVNTAYSALTGEKLARGRPQEYRDELLDMLFFDYGIAKMKGENASLESLAYSIVSHHPLTCDLAQKESIVTDLVRKFNRYGSRLIGEEMGDSGAPDLSYQIADILYALKSAGIKIEWDRFPPEPESDKGLNYGI